MCWTDEYLEKVASQIRAKRAREPLTEELREHMECQKEACLAESIAEAEAERRTVAGMGDALLVGGELDRAHRLRPQWRGIFIALLLIALLIRCALHFTRMENRMGAMIGMTATAELALQCALFYLSSFTGWSKEFCLPLLSYGNLVLLIDAALIGLLLSALRGEDVPEPAVQIRCARSAAASSHSAERA